MSDTPRTDVLLAELDARYRINSTELKDLARQLERENRELVEALKEIREIVETAAGASDMKVFYHLGQILGQADIALSKVSK